MGTLKQRRHVINPFNPVFSLTWYLGMYHLVRSKSDHSCWSISLLRTEKVGWKTVRLLLVLGMWKKGLKLVPVSSSWTQNIYESNEKCLAFQSMEWGSNMFSVLSWVKIRIQVHDVQRFIRHGQCPVVRLRPSRWQIGIWYDKWSTCP